MCYYGPGQVASGLFRAVAGGSSFDPAAWIVANAVAYWRMDSGGGGATETDVTGGGNNIVDETGLVAPATGKVGDALLFNSGDGTYLTRTSRPDLTIDVNLDWLCAVWVKLANITARTTCVISKPAEYQLLYTGADADRFQFNWGDGAGSITADTFGSPSTDTWYLLFVWVDSTNQQLYIRVNNGTPDVNSLADVAASSANPFFIGTTDSAFSFFDGPIDEPIIFKPGTPLTSTEADALCSYIWNGGAARDLSLLF